MATKNIARSALEGGRYSYNKWERRHSHNEERAQVRDYLNRVKADPENADDEQCDGLRPVHKEFTDKLAPMYRWLEKQVGRSWADVRSEIAQKFDTRTTAGRHITFDHLLRQVVDTESGFDNYGYMIDPDIEVVCDRGKYKRGGYATYYVDQAGILQINGDSYSHRRRHYRYESVTEEECIEASNWLNGSIVGLKDGKYCWFVPTEGIWKASFLDGPKTYYRETKLKYYVEQTGPYTKEVRIPTNWSPSGFWTEKAVMSGLHWEYVENPFSFRQSGELTKTQLKTFMGFKESLRAQILEFGKGR